MKLALERVHPMSCLAVIFTTQEINSKNQGDDLQKEEINMLDGQRLFHSCDLFRTMRATSIPIVSA